MFSVFPKGLLLLLLAAALMIGACNTTAPTSTPAGAAPATTTPVQQQTVGIVQLVAHPALDLVRDGLVDSLKEAGFQDGENINMDVQNAQGQLANTKTIADKFVADKVDLIIAITTPASQSAVKATQGTDIPMVFVAVSDAVSAGLVESVDAPSGTNVSGVYNAEPVQAQVDLITRLAPNIKALGVVYNPGEANSVSLVETLKKELDSQGISLVEGTVTSSSDVLSASRSLVDRVDAIYVPQDNTVVSALEALIKTANEAKLPLFAGDTESVKRGAIATSGNDEYETGRQAGVIAARVLNGEDAGQIKPEVTEVQRIVLNAKAAETVAITIPADLIEQASEVIR
jgi:putative ABC transport system substrate-binding protein